MKTSKKVRGKYDTQIFDLELQIKDLQSQIEKKRATISSIKEKINLLQEIEADLMYEDAQQKIQDLFPSHKFTTSSNTLLSSQNFIKPLTNEEVNKFCQRFTDIQYSKEAKWPMEL